MKKAVALLLVILMCFSFCSCSTVDKGAIINEAQTILENTFLKLNNNDIEEVEKHMDIGAVETKLSSTLSEVDIYYGTDKFLDVWFPTVSCTVESSGFIDENKINFTANITSADMWNYYQGFYSAMMQDILDTKKDIDSVLKGNYVEPSYRSQSEITNKFIEAGVNEITKGQKCTNSVNITLIKVDGEWKIEMSDELCVAILGDIDKASTKVTEIMRS